MKRNLFLLIFFIAVATLFLGVQKASAQEIQEVTDDEVLAVAKKLYCPVCPNTPLDVCETQACQDWRAQIKDQLSSGWSEQQIIEYFVAQYGERVLAEPERKGFTSLVWVLPVIAVLLGGAIVWRVLRSWHSNTSVQVPAVAPINRISPEVIAEIEKELKEME
jgi:cytochrome c-type biogenesis protein CcmH